MEQETKTCTRCYKSKEISFFQTNDGKLKKTCNQCREYSSSNVAKKRGTNLDLFQELEKSELKQMIKSKISGIENEFFENTQGIQLQCSLSTDEFEENDEE